MFAGLVLITVALMARVSALKVLDSAVHYGFSQYKDRCTAIAIGKTATADGSTITTHNNDCQECDFRITHVPARDWLPGSKRPVHPIRSAYPRYVEKPGHDVHGPDYYPGTVDTTIYNWSETPSYFEIDQVAHTYSYTLGSYAIQNEKQVSIGESTCSSVFVAAPVTAGGKAVMHMETLTELALERCDTARCAIQLMGDLAVQYGFYGPDWDANLSAAQDEAGEALTVSDPNEAWMFHVMPDDTGASAIWVAQRVPDDHITVVANAFVIGEVNMADSANFLGSANLFDVAVRNNLWSPDSGKPFNFATTYGTDRHETSYGCTRRVWRVLTKAAPSLLPVFSAYTDGLQTFGFGADGSQPYPFSVKPDQPLTIQDVMNMNRDQYEGTDFDMSASLDGGPFGDTMRFPPTPALKDPENGVTYEEFEHSLGSQRAISLFRTSYSTVTQSRAHLPDVIGAVTWIAQYAPHHSSFVPVYAAASKTPSSLNTGTQYKLDKNSNWWIHCLTGNYLSRWYKYTIGDVQTFQKKIESSLEISTIAAESAALAKIRAAQHTSRPSAAPTTSSTRRSHRSNGSNSEGEATEPVSTPEDQSTTPPQSDVSRELSVGADLPNVDPTAEAVKILTAYHETAAASVRDQWWEFFFYMAGKYRDMYEITNPHAESFQEAYRYLTISRQWFEVMGLWGAPGTPPHDQRSPVPVKPINVLTQDTREDYAKANPRGVFAAYEVASVYQQPPATPTTTPVNTPSVPQPAAPTNPDTNNGGSAPTAPVNNNNNGKGSTVNSGNSSNSNSGSYYLGLFTALVFGIVIGVSATLLYLQQRVDYTPLR